MQEYEILVVGSLAFDVMFSIPNDFRQSIPLEDGKIKDYNATYIADRKNEYPGGTAGNIAAWLSVEGKSGSIFSAWGQDLQEKGYAQKLKSAGHELKGSEGDFTAHCYNVSDPLHQQLVIWQPNHYEANQTQKLSDYYEASALKNIKYAIFAAGTPSSITNHMEEFRAINKEAFIIFDPGQVSPFFNKDAFQKCISLANLIIGNKVEATHFDRYLEAPWPNALTRVVTLGAEGVQYYQPGATQGQFITAPKAPKVVETTGAGDAFRAGLISGLYQQKTLEEALQIGAQLGAQSVALPQPQPLQF